MASGLRLGLFLSFLTFVPISCVRDHVDNGELDMDEETKKQHLQLQKMLEESNVQEEQDVNENAVAHTNTSALDKSKTIVCHDLCVVCGDGQRAVFIKRGKAMWKKILDIVLVPTAVVGLVFAPWMTIIGGSLYLLADKHFADKLGPECPNVQIIQFDRSHDAKSANMVDVKDELKDQTSSVSLLTKDLEKMYGAEMDRKRKEAGTKKGFFSGLKGVFVSERPHGRMTELIMNLFNESPHICKDNSGVKMSSAGPEIIEQGSLSGTWQSFEGSVMKMFGSKDAEVGFAHTCMEHYKIN